LNMDYSPLFISVKTSLLAVAITVVLGIGAARLFMNANSRLQWLLDVIFTLPLVLPPTVVGFILLVIFGKNSGVGQALASIGQSIIFTSKAAVLAAVVVSFPLMYRSAKGAFEQVDVTLIWAARTLGLSEARICFSILFPLALPGLLSGAVLSFARALGEFGATLMIAGNIPRVTQTMPVAIYFANAAGKTDIALMWCGVILVFSFTFLGILNLIGQKERKIARRGESE
jgi:molybdate transport system permease protein